MIGVTELVRPLTALELERRRPLGVVAHVDEVQRRVAPHREQEIDEHDKSPTNNSEQLSYQTQDRRNNKDRV